MTTSALPAKHQVLQACRGAHATANPLLRSAKDLTTLHERLLVDNETAEAINDIDRTRSALIREIDRWITTQLPPAQGSAHIHTETVGAVIDRMARYTAEAYAALAGSSDIDLVEAWQRLGELAIGYDDLAAELCAGVRRLPGAA